LLNKDLKFIWEYLDHCMVHALMFKRLDNFKVDKLRRPFELIQLKLCYFFKKMSDRFAW